MEKGYEQNISADESREMGNDVDVDAALQPSTIWIPCLSLKYKDCVNSEVQFNANEKRRQETKRSRNTIISRERCEQAESFRSRNCHLLKYPSGDHYSPLCIPLNMKVVNKEDFSLDSSTKTEIIICGCVKSSDMYDKDVSEPSSHCLSIASLKEVDNLEHEDTLMVEERQATKKRKVRKNLINAKDQLQMASSVQQIKDKRLHNLVNPTHTGSKQDTSKQSSCGMETVFSSSYKSSAAAALCIETMDHKRDKTKPNTIFTKYIAISYPPGSRIHSLGLNRWDDREWSEAQWAFEGHVYNEVSRHLCNYSFPLKKHVVLFRLPKGMDSRFDQKKVALFMRANTEISNKYVAILCSDVHETKNVSLHHVMKELCLSALKSYLFPAGCVRFLWVHDLQSKAFDLLKDHNTRLMFPSLAYLNRYHAVLVLGGSASYLLRHQQTCFLHSIASVLHIKLNEILVLHSTEPNCHLKAFDKNG